MVRYLSWLANAALLTLGCFLVANTANAVFAALLTPSPAERAPAPAPEAPTGRSWGDRLKILDRNLFNASLLAPAVQKKVEEDLQATKLPLALLGTVASPDERLSWAAIEDKDLRKHLVLRLHDDVKEGKARVVSIERRRVVLSENGELRELVLSENRKASASTKVSKRPSRKSRVARRRASRSRSPAPQPAPEQNYPNPASLISGAGLLPKFEGGQMVGVQVSGIKPGSLYEQVGMKEGDVITEVNGIKITSPEDTYNIMQQVTEAGQMDIGVDRAGVPQTFNVSLDELFNR